MNNRRRLVIALGAGAVAIALPAFAQQGKVWRVGFLSLRRIEISGSDNYYGPFRQGMRKLGYAEGKNLVIEWRSAEGNSERLRDLATELVSLKVDVILVAGTTATGAAQKATTTIPIVMAAVSDPVGSGFVKSLAHPGGNITGLSNLGTELGTKHLEMLLGMAPNASRVAVLVNPANPSHPAIVKNLEAVRRPGLSVLSFSAQSSREIEDAFAQMVRQKVRGLIVAPDSFFVQQRQQLAELAAKSRLPSISFYREYAEAGGLISYGASVAEAFERMSTYVDKIFKGAKPADLPIEQPTKFELYINGRTAKALGLKIPYALQIMVDKVIE
jgi:putative ABC transport system substrate-binding protein